MSKAITDPYVYLTFNLTNEKVEELKVLAKIASKSFNSYCIETITEGESNKKTLPRSTKLGYLVASISNYLSKNLNERLSVEEEAVRLQDIKDKPSFIFGLMMKFNPLDRLT